MSQHLRLGSENNDLTRGRMPRCVGIYLWRPPSGCVRNYCCQSGAEETFEVELMEKRIRLCCVFIYSELIFLLILDKYCQALILTSY